MRRATLYILVLTGILAFSPAVNADSLRIPGELKLLSKQDLTATCLVRASQHSDMTADSLLTATGAEKDLLFRNLIVSELVQHIWMEHADAENIPKTRLLTSISDVEKVEVSRDEWGSQAYYCLEKGRQTYELLTPALAAKIAELAQGTGAFRITSARKRAIPPVSVPAIDSSHRGGGGPALLACLGLMNSHTQIGGDHLDNKRDEIETKSL